MPSFQVTLRYIAMIGNNHQLEDPQGVDFAIQRLQNFLFKNLSWENVEMFGRVDKVPNPENKTAFKPYAYYSGIDYRPVVRDDKFNANVFFVPADRATTKEGILFTIEIKVVFMVNLAKLYPGYAGRADQLAQKEANEAIKAQSAFSVTSIGTGLKESLGEFDIEDLKFTNMHPNHVFCITGNLNYHSSC